MANSSVFPSQIDSFKTFSEIPQSQRASLATYQSLLQLSTLTPDQQTQLTQLTESLAPYLVSSDDLNLITNSIVNIEQFFAQNVNSYFDNFKFLGAWSQSTSYQEWNTVTFNGQSYLSLQSPNLGNEPDTTPSYWALIAKQGSVGPQGPAGAALSYVGTYNSLSTYQQNQLVSYNGSTYICLQNNTTNQPPTNTTYWTLFVTGATPQAQSSAPTNPVVNQLWIDTSTAGDPLLKYWSGSAWVVVSPDPTDMAKRDVDNAFSAKQTFDAGLDIPSGQTGTVEGVLQVGTGGVINATELSGMAQTDVIQNRVSPNIVDNGDFEVVTTTATVFSDALTSYSGSTVPAPWTLQSGSFTFGASGATCGTTNSIITAGNAVWEPIIGSDGTTKLTITNKASYTIPATMQSIRHRLHHDANNYYYCLTDGATFYLYKVANGTQSTLTSASATVSVSASYTVTLALDNAGNLTATLKNSSGTTLQTLNYTDSSPLSGGFLIGVGGDTGVVISQASCVGPWANSWTIGGDSRVAWGLTQSAISGKYSVSAVGVANVEGFAYQSLSLSTSTQYTVSGYMSTSGVGTHGVEIHLNAMGGTNATTTLVTGTTSTTRYSATTTTGTGSSPSVVLDTHDSGTVTFDNIQLEQGSTATPYIPQTQRLQTPIDVPSLTINGSNIVTSVNGQTGAITVQGYNPLTNPMAWIG